MCVRVSTYFLPPASDQQAIQKTEKLGVPEQPEDHHASEGVGKGAGCGRDKYLHQPEDHRAGEEAEQC